jgi:hypothetical protein
MTTQGTRYMKLLPPLPAIGIAVLPNQIWPSIQAPHF